MEIRMKVDAISKRRDDRWVWIYPRDTVTAFGDPAILSTVLKLSDEVGSASSEVSLRSSLSTEIPFISLLCAIAVSFFLFLGYLLLQSDIKRKREKGQMSLK